MEKNGGKNTSWFYETKIGPSQWKNKNQNFPFLSVHVVLVLEKIIEPSWSCHQDWSTRTHCWQLLPLWLTTIDTCRWTTGGRGKLCGLKKTEDYIFHRLSCCVSMPMTWMMWHCDTKIPICHWIVLRTVDTNWATSTCCMFNLVRGFRAF